MHHFSLSLSLFFCWDWSGGRVKKREEERKGIRRTRELKEAFARRMKVGNELRRSGTTSNWCGMRENVIICAAQSSRSDRNRIPLPPSLALSISLDARALYYPESNQLSARINYRLRLRSAARFVNEKLSGARFPYIPASLRRSFFKFHDGSWLSHLRKDLSKVLNGVVTTRRRNYLRHKNFRASSSTR